MQRHKNSVSCHVLRTSKVREPESPKCHPYWLRKTKRLFPHPLFAGCISVACAVVGILFAGVALNVAGTWPVIFPSILFFAGALATASAAITRSHSEPSNAIAASQQSKPTFAIFVLLVGIYSWLLTVAMHVFDLFFKNGPGSVKYFVTLGIAITCTLFMQLHGKRVIRKHFGPTGHRNPELSSRQAIYITVFVVFVGGYLAWLVT
jgi:hypothetical protein